MTRVEAAHMVAAEAISTFPNKWAIRFRFKNDVPMEEEYEVVASPAAAANVVAASPAVTKAASNSAAGENEDSTPATAADHFANNYLTTNNTKFTETIALMNERDKQLYQTLLNKTSSIIDAVTFKIWDDIDAKELEDKINACIKVELEPPAITKATVAVSFMMEGIDLTNPPTELEDFLKVRFDQHTKPLRDEISKLKRNKRLNFFGGKFF